MDILIQQTGNSIWLILLLSLPPVLLAASIGLIIGIIQAVTQVQEQTISAAPKIALVFLLVIFAGPLMLQIISDFFVTSVHLGTEVMPHESLMALPPKDYRGNANGAMSRDQFFDEHSNRPRESKLKGFMNSPSSVRGGEVIEGADIKTSVKPTPKMGVGEKIYVKRRSNGTLPEPPKTSPTNN